MARRPIGDEQIDDEISHGFPRRIFIEKEIKGDEEKQTTKIYRCNSASQSERRDEPKWSFALRLIFSQKHFVNLFFHEQFFLRETSIPTNRSCSKISLTRGVLYSWTVIREQYQSFIRSEGVKCKRLRDIKQRVRSRSSYMDTWTRFRKPVARSIARRDD